jgi:hypothetical protein
MACIKVTSRCREQSQHSLASHRSQAAGGTNPNRGGRPEQRRTNNGEEFYEFEIKARHMKHRDGRTLENLAFAKSPQHDLEYS